ncbi:putative E3 ubiquitin-protein ligase ubr7, partial [Entomortierella beljakovae]
CSSSMGYIRQPVYSCLTCNPNPSEEAGFCYSCSISCHGEHNLVELFTKRSFRCDCGTGKFKDTKCKLDAKPAGSCNELNKYNHNYLGRFCWCDIQYDPLKEESTMLQCVVCEDWFHDTCIGITPHNDDFDDFICRTCTRSHSFLRRYAQNSLFMIGLSKVGEGPISVTMVDCSKKGKNDEKVVNDTNSKPEGEEIDIISTESFSTTSSVNDVTTDTTTTTITHSTSISDHSSHIANQAKRSLETEEHDSKVGQDEGGTESNQNKKPKLDVDSCKKAQLPVDIYPDQEMNLFASEGWRDILCQCGECMKLYNKEEVPFILGEEAIYEDDDDDEAETSILEGGMKKLGEMDRVQIMDGMLAYNKMRDEIRNFLAPFSEQGKVVTADAIQAFFTEKMEKRAAQGGKPNFF